jgi:transcription-repair coupling factor (superfamily II helicase)
MIASVSEVSSAGALPHLEQLSSFIAMYSGKILFTVESLGRREVLQDIFRKHQIGVTVIERWSDFSQNPARLQIVIAPFEQGFINDDPLNPWVLITEAELLERRITPQARKRSVQASTVSDHAIRYLEELNLGDAIVHLDHGVGRYQGLTHLVLSQEEGEFVTLEYAGGDKLYVPVFSLHLLSRYSSIDTEHAPLHRLGGEQWQKAKRQALEQVRDSAAELLEIYAKRAIKPGNVSRVIDEQYERFCKEFPFEETPDQAQAIAAVLQDLAEPRPMDRLVCGDVGFGKTEVALRAAFVAVHSGKQVAVLVPTTLLAQQHFQTFQDRFANFPIRVEVLSRFKLKQAQDQVIDALAQGTVDIVIGTHKLLQKEVKFKQLGLVIIDEEHRVGVRQKEMFKALRAEIDILTLTATPIPRTLNMAMSGLRDLSIIATPPAKRLSIKTFVREYQAPLIQEAIQRELNRGGQVYFLHNDIDTIHKMATDIQIGIPHARVQVAHGRMRERELEQCMSDFYHRRFDVLVCTTIIETGIDIPTANTIVINRADKFGLAQLHQLRGRVGRSHHQAYAFCLTPADVKLSSDAQKRLEALTSLEELGVGFSLATHDLEIRGSGELLGEDQSGQVQNIGFTLYLEMLDHAVKMLKAGKEPTLDTSVFRGGIEVDLQLPAFIPESYIPDVSTRLVLYKRLSEIKTSDQLHRMENEILDRFGPFPEQVRYLLANADLKRLASQLSISKIDVGKQGGRLEFHVNGGQFRVEKMIEWIQTEPKIYKLDKQQRFCFTQNLVDHAKRISWVKALLEQLRVQKEENES